MPATTTRTRARRRQQANRPPVTLPADPDRQVGDRRGLRVDGREVSYRIGDRLTGARLSRVISGANTLSLDLYDGDRQVLTSGVLGERVMTRVAEITLDELAYTIVGDSRAGDTLTLTCEDALVTHLKRDVHDRPLVRSRRDITRAAFCAEQIRAAGVPCLVLDEDVAQPIKGAKDLRERIAKAKREQTSRRRGRSRSTTVGITASGLTVKGAPASKEQRQVIATALRVAGEQEAQPRATLALVAAIITESVARNLNGGDQGSRGVLQLLPKTAANLGVDPRDIRAVCKLFLTRGFWVHGSAMKIARERRAIDVAMVAQLTQGSGTADGSNYREWLPEARRWVKAAGGLTDEDAGPDGDGRLIVKDYRFERRRGESTYACCRRLLDEVRWLLFIREGVALIATGPALAAAAPSQLLTAGPGGNLDQDDFDRMRGMPAQEATLRAWVGAYATDPGEVQDVPTVPTENGEPWLCSEATVDLLVPGPVDLKVIEAPAPLAEPTPETTQRQTSRSDDNDEAEGTGGLPAGSKVAKALAFARDVARKRWPYKYGGGHGSFAGPYDCSGFVSALLDAAGLLGSSSPMDTVALGSWGQAGKGKYLTIWVKPLSGMDGHTFAEFHLPDGSSRFYEAGGTRGLPTGLRPGGRSTSGFQPRHAPGT